MTKEGVKHLNGMMNACKAEVPWPCVFYDDFIHLLIVLKLEDVVHVATDSTNWSFTTGKNFSPQAPTQRVSLLLCHR